MIGGCNGCLKKLNARDDFYITIINEAIMQAKATGEWYAIYENEEGELKYIDARYAPGRTIKYVSPQMQYLTL